MKYYLSKQTLKNIDGIHEFIKLIIFRMIYITNVDFGVIENGGLRTIKMQNKIFKDGFSNCDGINKVSYHQSGKAVDLVPFVDGKFTWSNKDAFIELFLTWKEAEAQLKKENKIPKYYFFHHGILWGWKDLNQNGILEITDKLGWDCAHHEIRSKQQKINV